VFAIYGWRHSSAVVDLAYTLHLHAEYTVHLMARSWTQSSPGFSNTVFTCSAVRPIDSEQEGMTDVVADGLLASLMLDFLRAVSFDCDRISWLVPIAVMLSVLSSNVDRGIVS
jgi:hypothetical protein